MGPHGAPVDPPQARLKHPAGVWRGFPPPTYGVIIRMGT